ncbi:IS110 family transposase [Pseudomonadota bacterium]
MRFYTKTHQFYCGIDLHARSMYLCILDHEGNTLVHRNMPTNPERFLKAVAPYREDLVVAVECIFTWYWIADLCRKENIDFVLGHALYMRAIHGGKAKNDKIDADKIARLLRSNMLPQAYVYPPEMRATRDLMRRRNHLVNKRAELLTHIQNTNSQYNLPAFGKKICRESNRDGVAERFSDPCVEQSIGLDISLIDVYDEKLKEVELYILRVARGHNPETLQLLKTVPGIGKILALVLLYEIHTIDRFEKVGNFLSYSRLVKCAKESAGKRYGTSGAKIGNVHLRWAFGEAACLFLRQNEAGQKFHQRLVKKHGKAKALSILAQKIGRAVYYMLKRKQAFNMKKFING